MHCPWRDESTHLTAVYNWRNKGELLKNAYSIDLFTENSKHANLTHYLEDKHGTNQ